VLLSCALVLNFQLTLLHMKYTYIDDHEA
jgi:hypothetical protein